MAGPVFVHPEIIFANFRTHFTAFLIINLLSTLYTIASVFGFWARSFNELGRFLLAFCAGLGTWAVIVILVYFRSWFG